LACSLLSWPGVRNERGFTLIELLVVVAIIGILASTAVLIFANVTTRARVAKAQADVRSLSSAIAAYSAHVSSFPPTLADLTVVASNAQGITAGPFLGAVPLPPDGWGAAYAYATATTGTFTISAAGDNVTVSGP
jgi:type II secretion system protein G